MDGCGFFNFVVVRLPFNLISDGSEWWLFYILVAILMWLCKEASHICLYCHLDQKSLYFKFLKMFSQLHKVSKQVCIFCIMGYLCGPGSDEKVRKACSKYTWHYSKFNKRKQQKFQALRWHALLTENHKKRLIFKLLPIKTLNWREKCVVNIINQNVGI